MKIKWIMMIFIKPSNQILWHKICSQLIRRSSLCKLTYKRLKDYLTRIAYKWSPSIKKRLIIKQLWPSYQVHSWPSLINTMKLLRKQWENNLMQFSHNYHFNLESYKSKNVKSKKSSLKNHLPISCSIKEKNHFHFRSLTLLEKKKDQWNLINSRFNLIESLGLVELVKILKSYSMMVSIGSKKQILWWKIRKNILKKIRRWDKISKLYKMITKSWKKRLGN